ncbi:hypothetical protein ACOMHN_014328 [Nucella lapillus]
MGACGQCQVKDAPISVITTSVAWTRCPSAWSVVGAMTCAPNHTYSGQDPAVRCSPAQPYWFSINFFSTENIVLHEDFRLLRAKWSQNNTLALNSRIGSLWANDKQQIRLDPFPVIVDQMFRIRVFAVDSYAIELYVDDALIAQHTLPLAIQDIVTFIAMGDVTLTWIDLWC